VAWASRAWEWLIEYGGWLLALVVGIATLGLVRPRKPTQPELAVRAIAGPIRAEMRDRATAAADEAHKQRVQATIDRQRAEAEAKRVAKMSDAEVVDTYRSRYRDEVSNRKGGGGTALLVLLSALAFPSLAQATEPTSAPHPETGEMGLWVDWDTARKDLADLQRVPHLDAEIVSLRSAVGHQDVALANLQSVADAAIAQASAAESVAEAEHERADKIGAWWRRGRFWAPVGVVLGMAAAISIGAAL
jgi:hypothetical protein